MKEHIGPTPNRWRCSYARRSALRNVTSPVVACAQMESLLPFQLYWTWIIDWYGANKNEDRLKLRLRLRLRLRHRHRHRQKRRLRRVPMVGRMGRKAKKLS